MQGIEQTLTDKILALFKEHNSLNLSEIQKLLSNENPASVKEAVSRLRGKGGVKRLRVKGYVKISGRAGLEVPTLEVGNHPDIEKTVDSIEINDEVLRRARRVRKQREEHKYKKEMAALDW